jgi:hypothetical protein
MNPRLVITMAKNMQTNILLGGKVLPSLNNAFAMANKRMMQTNRTANVFSKTTGAMSRAFGTASRFIGLDSLLMGAGLGYVSQKGLMLSSDLKEVQNVVDVTFGKSSKAIDAFSKTANDSFGLSELQAKKFTGTLGAMLKSSGLSSNMVLDMSKSLTALTGDFSSFYNVSQGDMFEKIQAGISGEIKPLRDLGINLSVANLEAFALSKGIKTSWDKMGQANQVAIRYAYLMSVSKDAQGDFTRTQGSFANQLRLVQNNFDKIISTVAGKFLPTANKAVTWANKFMTNLDVDKLGQSFSTFGNEVTDVFSNYIQPALNWAITTGWPMFKDGVITTYNAAKTFTDLVIDNWPLIEPILFGIGTAMVFNRIAMMALNKETALGMGITVLSRAWGAAAFTLEWMRAGLSLTTLAQWALNGAMAANPIGVIITGIGILGAALYALYKNWSRITKFFIDSWAKVKAFFTGDVNAPVIAANNTATINPNLVRHANGGFSNRAAIFGEAGLEAAIPIKPGNARSIGLLNRTARMLGVSGDGQNITYAPVIYVSGDGDVKEQARKGVEAAYPGFENMIDNHFGGRRRLSFV